MFCLKSLCWGGCEDSAAQGWIMSGRCPEVTSGVLRCTSKWSPEPEEPPPGSFPCSLGFIIFNP